MAALQNDPTEVERLAALAEYAPDDAPADLIFAHIVDFATALFEVPTAFISFVGRESQRFFAKVGTDLCETSRNISFCTYAIQQADPFIVLDARRDQRFRDNPLVKGPPFLRFYAGMPLQSPAGHTLGTLCLADSRPRTAFSSAEERNLRDLARLVQDALAFRQLDLVRQASQSRFEHIAGTSPDGIICADQRGRITFWNAAAEQLFGYAASEALGQEIDLIVPDRMRGNHGRSLQRAAAGAATRLMNRTVELPAQHRDGSEFPVELSLSMWQEDGHPAFGVIIRDIRERRASEDRLFRLAHLDPLTGLPNRTVLLDRMHEIRGSDRHLTVMILDLDGFKEVNDRLGHAAGDQVLRCAADRLLTCVAPTDTIARLGGDEFAILLPDSADPCKATAIAAAVVEALAVPFANQDEVLRLSASVGIAINSAHVSDIDELLSCADMALYQAKIEGRSCYRLFLPALREQAQRERHSRDELRRAVENNEFVLFYQPQVRLSDGALIGAEALIRWQHPVRGLLTPAAFLETLDRSPYAAAVGDWVLRSACAQAALWRQAGAPEFRVGVNLCSAQFARGDLAAAVHATLAASGLPASALELEITENIILGKDADMVGTLQTLHAAGVGLSFDDYGTGYASLSLLKRFPLTRLKIDRSFVQGMCSNLQDAAIIRAVIELSRSFGLEVIAEGVETEDQRQRLCYKGCQQGQGYLFGKPMAAAEFAEQYGLGRPNLYPSGLSLSA